jgi:hypothetical protein
MKTRLIAPLLLLATTMAGAHPGHDLTSDASHFWGTVALLAVLGLGVWSRRGTRRRDPQRRDRGDGR